MTYVASCKYIMAMNLFQFYFIIMLFSENLERIEKAQNYKLSQEIWYSIIIKHIFIPWILNTDSPQTIKTKATYRIKSMHNFRAEFSQTYITTALSSLTLLTLFTISLIGKMISTPLVIVSIYIDN